MKNIWQLRTVWNKEWEEFEKKWEVLEKKKRKVFEKNMRSLKIISRRP